MKWFEVEGTLTMRFSQLVQAEDEKGAEMQFEEEGFPSKSTGFLDITREVLSVEEVDDGDSD